MRKSFSVSAILSSLLATPLLAAVPVKPNSAAGAAAGEEGQAQVYADPLQQALQNQMDQLAQGAPLDAHGMQQLQRQINREMHEHLNRTLAHYQALAAAGNEGRFFPVQLAQLHVQHMEKAAFLGVSTSPVTPALREQLQLPRGMGLIVDFIEKDSPADQAGFKVHDVIQKLEDQNLVNAQQLAVLVRAKNPGDSVAFTVIRGGKPTTLTAKLVEKEVPALENMQEPGLFMPGAAPQQPRGDALVHPHGTGTMLHIDAGGDWRRMLTDDQNSIELKHDKDGTTLTVKDHAGNKIYDGPAEKAELSPEIQKKVDELEKQSNRIRIHMTGPDGQPAEIEAGGITFAAPGGDPTGAGGGAISTTLTRSDDEHVITMRMESPDGVHRTRMLTVKDKKTGAMLFDGPVQSDDDLKKLPPEVVDKINKLKARMDAP